MALHYKTIKLMEEIAERLENWAEEWRKQLLKDRPDNLRQLRESVLVGLTNTDFPHLNFKMEFCSSLKEALKEFQCILEELSQYMPNTVQLVQEKHDKLMDDTSSVGQLNVDSCEWLRKVNDSRNSAISLAKTLRHIAKIAREERKWRIVKRVLKIVGAIIISIIAAIVTKIFFDFGLIGRIKDLFTK